MAGNLPWEELERRGLYDPGAPDAAEQRELLEYLSSEGVTVDDMVEAKCAGRLPFAAGDVRIRPGVPVLSAEEVAARVGLDPALLARVWRALGLAIPTAGKPAYSEADVEALALLAAAIERFGVEPALQLARVFGASLARMAAAGFQTSLAYAQDGFAPRAASVLASARASTELGTMAQMAGPGIEVLFRHHVAAATHWFDLAPSPDPETAPLAVGFADLVGFTSLTQILDVPALARAVTEFDAVTSEIAGDGDGRVVKLIGDEVMFVAPTARQAVSTAIALVAALTDHPILPPLRAAVACGTVLVRDGDCFGPVVNLAARLVHLAEPGDVIVPEGTLAPGSGFAVEPLGIRDVRGFDHRVAVARVRA